MRKPAKISRWTLLGVICLTALCLTTLSGCGVNDYNKLLAGRVGQLRAGGPFRILWGPTQLADTPISIRVPLIFTKPYREDSAHPDDGAKINPDRVQPPFLRLPGFKLCYEGLVGDQPSGKLPFYCYLAAIPSKPGDAAKLAADLQAQLKEKFKDTPDAWEEIDAKTPEDFSKQWKKIRVKGDQPFLVKNNAKVDVVTAPGIFELWMHDAQDWVVLVAWRSPASIEGPSMAPPDAGAKLTALQQLQQTAGAGKPDLSLLPALTAGTVTTAAPGGGAPAAAAE